MFIYILNIRSGILFFYIFVYFKNRVNRKKIILLAIFFFLIAIILNDIIIVKVFVKDFFSGTFQRWFFKSRYHIFETSLWTLTHIFKLWHFFLITVLGPPYMVCVIGQLTIFFFFTSYCYCAFSFLITIFFFVLLIFKMFFY